jgi:hypothetical protein
MNEAAALPSPRVLLSRRLDRYCGRLRRPPGSRSTSRLNTGYRTRPSGSTITAGCRAGEGLPSSRRHHLNVPRPLRRGVPRGCASRLFAPSMAFAVRDATRLSLPPAHRRAHQRRGRLRFTLRTAQSLPPTGLLTLGFDPARFQTEPPACYRASWQLPGRNSHPQATTSLCWISYPISTSNTGRTLRSAVNSRGAVKATA